MTKKLPRLIFASAFLLQAAPTAALAANAPVCLQTYEIDHTEVMKNRSGILFYMRGHIVWKNTFIGECVTLTPDRGFVYEVTNNELCSNMETIRVIGTGETCLLGEFTRYTPPKPAR